MTSHHGTKPTVKKAELSLQRRDLLKTASGLAAASLVPVGVFAPNVVRAADTFRYKLGISLAETHPIPAGLKAACAEILSESNKRLQIDVFPNGQFGSDADMMSQVRSGAIDLFSTAGLVWGTLLPVAAINIVAFAFPDYKAVWAAMDGDLGAHIRAAFLKANLVPQSKIWDHGFRHITSSHKPINTPQDLAGMKIRVPVNLGLTSLFKALNAAPTSTSYAELYTALQTNIVDGQENPLATLETAKLYEVQKFCSLTSHAWDGFWLVSNKRSWEALPDNLRQLASRIFDSYADKERVANADLNATLLESLKGRGMSFNTVDTQPFREMLKKAGYYKEWQQKFGSDAWTLLEKYSGPLT